MLRKRSGRRTSSASCVTRMLLVVEVRIASSRQWRLSCSKASRLASSVSGTPSKTSSASASAAGASAASTSSTRSAIASTCAGVERAESCEAVEAGSISARASSRSCCQARGVRGAGRPARCGGPRRRRRSRCRGPCGRRRRRRSAPWSSVAIVQALLQRCAVSAGEAQRLERARPCRRSRPRKPPTMASRPCAIGASTPAQRATEARKARPSSVSSVM